MLTLKCGLVVTAATCILTAIPTANASFNITASIGGGVGVTGASQFNFDTLAIGGAGGNVNSLNSGSTVKVSFVTDGQAAAGAVSGKYAMPYLSGNNGVGFGPGGTAQVPKDGQDGSIYLTSGISSGSMHGEAKLVFNSPQNYLGLLWGSVDDYNTLSFYLGGAKVGDVTGLQVKSNANGDQGINGTVYANIFTDSMFDTVVATSSNYAFEFDNIAVAAVPEPSTIIAGAFLLLPFGVSAWRSVRRNRA